MSVKGSARSPCVCAGTLAIRLMIAFKAVTGSFVDRSMSISNS